jgi:hypothetical protein
MPRAQEEYCNACKVSDDEADIGTHEIDGESENYCERCWEKLACNEAFDPPKYYFIVKPRKKRYNFDRLTFIDEDEFRDWAEGEDEDTLDKYRLGLYRSDKWSTSEQNVWILNGHENNSELFYWMGNQDNGCDNDDDEDNRDDSKPLYEILIQEYKDGGDGEIWSTYDNGNYGPKNDKFEETIEKIQSETIQRLRTRLDRLENE